MTPLRIDLDSGARHYVTLERGEAGAAVLTLHHSSAARRSPLHEALHRQLRLRVEGQELALAPQRDLLALPAGARRLELGLREGPVLAVAGLAGQPVLEESRYVLSPFESRFLAETGRLFPLPEGGRPETRRQTDLHVHFAGCVGARDLVRLGAACGVRYPTALLGECGMHFAGPEALPLGELPEEFQRQLAAQLAIPLDYQATFPEMERIYRLRGPITKNPAAFLPLCRQIAADYQAMGVRYAELSLSDVVESSRLRALQTALPALEREFGVRLRFLAALSRHDDPEWDLDYLDRLETLAGCRALVGLDFMGHETNSTRAFAPQLRAAAQRLGRVRPQFVIRVHAGENPAYPENVRVALECVEGCDVQLRIGHGLYGVDEATLTRLRERGAMVEFNLNSNLALNNIQEAAAVPIQRYLRHGIPVVLGTDGYGIYQTSLPLEDRAAVLCGLQPVDFEQIRATEEAYLRRQEEAARALPALADFVVPEPAPRRFFTAEVAARKASARQGRGRALRETLAQLGVPLLENPGLAQLRRGRRCLSLAGAWRKSWEAISPPQRVQIREELQRLLQALSPERTLLVTGGTVHGLEGLVQELAIPAGFPVLGALVGDTPVDSLQSGQVTHACLVGQTLYDKAAGLYRLMQESHGFCIFIGGGSIVNDEIQTAANLRLPYALMEGPEGASTLQARWQPERAFRTAAELLSMLQREAWQSTDQPYWHLGVNPTVDLLLTRHEPATGRRQVLLIQRHVDAPSEGGKWALPGGFQLTAAPRGTLWQPSQESARATAARELFEEAGLDLREQAEALLELGSYEGGGRDPRDTAEAWSRSEVFGWHLEAAQASLPLCGGDDAADAGWFDVTALPAELAFDHARILREGLARLARALSEKGSA